MQHEPILKKLYNDLLFTFWQNQRGLLFTSSIAQFREIVNFVESVFYPIFHIK